MSHNSFDNCDLTYNSDLIQYYNNIKEIIVNNLYSNWKNFILNINSNSSPIPIDFNCRSNVSKDLNINRKDNIKNKSTILLKENNSKLLHSFRCSQCFNLNHITEINTFRYNHKSNTKLIYINSADPNNSTSDNDIIECYLERIPIYIGYNYTELNHYINEFSYMKSILKH